MNTRITLFVLLLALGIGLFAIIKLTGSGSATPSAGDTALADRTSQRLLDPTSYDPEKVQQIEITWADGPAVSFTRDTAGVWRQVKPVPFRVQTFAMRQLTTAAGDLTITKTISPRELAAAGEDGGEDGGGAGGLAALDLAPPAATVTYTLRGTAETAEGAPTLTLLLGSISVGGAAYAQLPDDARVYVVEDTLHNRVFKTAVNGWRELVVFDDLGPEMARIYFNNYENDTSFELRQIDKRWRMVAPVQTHLDQPAIGAFTQDLITARIRGFVSDDATDLSGWGLAEPAVELAVETDRINPDGSVSTTRQVLLLGNPIGLTDNSRYAKLADHPSVFTVPALFVERVMLTVETLVSKIVVDALVADVQAVQIDGPSGVFNLTRTLEGGWQAAAPIADADAVAINTEAVEALLARLTSAQAGVALGTLAEEDVALTMLVEGFGGTELAAFAVGTQATSSGEFRVVFDDGSGVVRFSDNVALPAFTIADYAGDPAGEIGVAGGGETGAVDPAEVSK